jgi:hypothetical protein
MIDVLLMFEINTEDREPIKAFFKKKGFEEVEEMTFFSQSNTNMFATKTYLIEMSKDALSRVEFTEAKMIFQLNEFEPECFIFDIDSKEFRNFELISE